MCSYTSIDVRYCQAVSALFELSSVAILLMMSDTVSLYQHYLSYQVSLYFY